ncbi:MAG: hypothetical protein JAZ17_17370 [Candidatus Thiodiazotropha endolucinida]|nr:hypothetical protein [Candidatus Thiodiazotropha taylori]MCG8095360.1 hypothetical protein [Candidatus Thiodiazotropha endolucinida]MCW4268762.1 hypothetical protein [Candidatus Thiodiazotropha endolucinida]
MATTSTSPDVFGIFKSSTDPETFNWLSTLWGSWIDGAGATTTAVATQIVTVIGYANAFAWPLVVIVIAYSMYVGVMNTASEGEVLGRRFSSIWLPIRSALAGILLLPAAATNDNLSVGQFLIGYAGYTGASAADYIWQKSYKNSFISPTTLTPHIDGKNAAKETLRALVCARFDTKWRGSKVMEMTSTGAVFAEGHCGSITIPKTLDPTLVSKLSSAIGQLTLDIQPIANNLKAIEDKDKTVQKQLINAANKYAISVEAAVADLLKIKPAVKDKKSFLYAGTYYLENTKTQQIAYANAEAVNQAIRFDTPKDKSAYKKLFGNGGNMQSKVLETLLNMTDEFLRDIEANDFTRTGIKRIDLDIMQFIDLSITDLIEIDEVGLMNHFGDWFRGIALGSALEADTADNPFTVASSLGNGFLIGGQALLVAGIGAGILSTAVGMMLMGFALMLIVNGIILAFVLPALPAVIILLVTIGFLITMVELMIAVPFASSLMAEPDGQGMGKYTPKFLLMVFDLILRLPITVIALFVSIAIAMVAFMVAKLILLDAGTIDMTGIWGAVGQVTIFVWVLFLIMTRSFSVITSLPQAALGWIPDFANNSAGNTSLEDTSKTSSGMDKGMKDNAAGAARHAPRIPTGGGSKAPKLNKIKGS